MIKQLTAMPKYETYKDSRVEWLGDIPKHWDLSKLGNCLKSVSVKNRPDLPLLSITREKGVIQRNVEDQNENHNYIPDDLSNYKVLKRGQFGMNKMKAWQGSYGVSDHTGIVSPAYFIFDFVKDIDPKFFHLAIRSRLYISYFGSASDGVRIGQWDLSKPRMKEIPFLIPKLSEQIAIAAFLDRKTAQIDQAVVIKEKQIALLEERKQILIQNAVTRGLNPDVPMCNSGVEWIGEIPAHWAVERLKFLISYFKGFAFKSEDFSESGVPIIKASNIKEFKVSGITSFISYSNQKIEFDRFRLKSGDIVVSTVGSKPNIIESAVGQLCSVNSEFDASYLNQNTVCIRPNCEIDNGFLKYSFASKYMRSSLDKKSLWIANQAYLEVDEILDTFITHPPKNEQTAIVVYIETESAKIDQAISIQQQQIDKLKEYKATLINSAVTGKIKVPELAEGRVIELAEAPMPEPVEGELVEDNVA